MRLLGIRLCFIIYYLITICSGIQSLSIDIRKTENENRNDKIPVYLSIAGDNEKSFSPIHSYAIESLIEIIKNNPGNHQVYNDIADLTTNSTQILNLPDTWHTTCLFIGGDEKKTQTDIYRNFKEGIKIPLKTSTFIYIPGKLLLSPTFFKDFNLIENKYPHMTLFVGESAGYQAVDSNYVMAALFDGYEDLSDLYKSGKIEDENFHFYRHLTEVSINLIRNQTTIIEKDVFIIKYGASLTLDAQTKKNY